MIELVPPGIRHGNIPGRFGTAEDYVTTEEVLLWDALPAIEAPVLILRGGGRNRARFYRRKPRTGIGRS